MIEMSRKVVLETLVETHEGGTFLGQEFKVVGDITDIDPTDTETGFSGVVVQLGDHQFIIQVYNG